MNVHDEPLHAEAVEGLFLSTVDNPRGACLSPIGGHCYLNLSVNISCDGIGSYLFKALRS